MISISERRAEHSFDGQNTQQVIINFELIFVSTLGKEWNFEIVFVSKTWRVIFGK